MKTVGIRELKTNLSKYIQLIKAGERVIIKERNEVVAELGKPSEFNENSNSSFQQLIDKEEATGSIIKAEIMPTILSNLKKENKINNKGLSDWRISFQETKKKK